MLECGEKARDRGREEKGEREERKREGEIFLMDFVSSSSLLEGTNAHLHTLYTCRTQLSSEVTRKQCIP